MKPSPFLFAFFMLAIVNANATDNWQICSKNRIIGKGNNSDENATITLKATDYKKKDCFTIQYNSETPNTEWNRNFYLTKESDENVATITMNEQTGSVSFKASALKAMMEQKQPVFIYTMSLPKDPAKAAMVRVRRILLCKVEWI